MKVKRTAIPLLLLFSAMLTAMVVLNSTATADSKHITFTEPVTVGNVVLEPGEYEVVWEGSGPEVLVSFMKGNKTVATATARLILEKSSYPHRAVEVRVMPDNSRALKRITFSNRALVFDLPSEP